MSDTTQDRPDVRPQRHGIDLFRIGGIQIRIDLSWILIFLLVLWSLSAGYFPKEHPGLSTSWYWGAGLLATLLFFGSVVLHELAHSFVALREGIAVPDITLFLFGGASRIMSEPKTPGAEFRIAVVGPLTSLLLAAGCWGLGHWVVMPADGLTGTIIGYLAWVNLAVGLFNLVPGFPLDGGRLLRALVWKRTGSFQRGTRAASDLGKGVAIVLMVLGGLQVFSGMILGGIWFILIGIFLRSIAKQGYEQLILRQALEGVRVSEVMTEDIATVPSAMTLEELTEQHFLREGRSSYPVVDGGHVRGVVAISDLSKTDRSRFSDVTVGQVMTPLAQLHTLSPETSLVEALAEMGPGNPRRQLVLENDHLLGMLGIEDLTRVMKVREALARP